MANYYWKKSFEKVDLLVDLPIITLQPSHLSEELSCSPVPIDPDLPEGIDLLSQERRLHAVSPRQDEYHKIGIIRVIPDPDRNVLIIEIAGSLIDDPE